MEGHKGCRQVSCTGCWVPGRSISRAVILAMLAKSWVPIVSAMKLSVLSEDQLNLASIEGRSLEYLGSRCVHMRRMIAATSLNPLDVDAAQLLEVRVDLTHARDLKCTAVGSTRNALGWR